MVDLLARLGGKGGRALEDWLAGGAGLGGGRGGCFDGGEGWLERHMWSVAHDDWLVVQVDWDGWVEWERGSVDRVWWLVEWNARFVE